LFIFDVFYTHSDIVPYFIKNQTRILAQVLAWRKNFQCGGRIFGADFRAQNLK